MCIFKERIKYNKQYSLIEFLCNMFAVYYCNYLRHKTNIF